MFLTFDVEPDAPPYQSDSYKGVEEGIPWILDFLDSAGVKATFFITGVVAKRYPELVKEIVGRGHEVGSHGLDHTRLDKLPREEAARNIRESLKILWGFYNVRSFRAPNLQLPSYLIPSLRGLGITVDSSIAVYKKGHMKAPGWVRGVLRVPATVTSSTIRLPGVLARRLTLPSSRQFHVLFYHPWEFVRIRRKPLYRPDIWMRTGDYARRMLEAIIQEAFERGFKFEKLGDAPSLCG
ncbi:MAG: polysaccharide deacetylase family protein [Crenarchaeota archaeon]|nr:polysaccharide deacetylase family protein [Thermoproteota archaeon]